MPATKSLSTIIASGTSNAAASTTTGTPINLATAYGALVTIKINNGATGPTVPAQAVVLVSGDGTNWTEFYRVGALTPANLANEWCVPIPAEAMRVRVDITANTVQAVTCEAFAQILTGI